MAKNLDIGYDSVESDERSLSFKIYKLYSEEIYPKVSSIRGSYRLRRLLKDWVLKDVDKANFEANPVKERNWDNLIILDACRYDLYKEVTGCEEFVISPGSHSADTIEKTYSSGDWSDTILVTANPHHHNRFFEERTGRKVEKTFHSVYKTFETDWDGEYGTVMPESIVKDSKTAEKLFPHKRKIIHFMQPHHPMIASNVYRRDGFGKFKGESEEDIWAKVESGELERETAVEAYRENLEYVLKYVDELKGQLNGKTVVTSDHGNLLGEGGIYGHPSDRKEVPLRRVPWDEYE